MRKIVLALVSILAIGVSAYGQTARTVNLTSVNKIGPASAPWIDERGSGINNHIIVWNVVGTVSTCSVKLQQSPDGTTWSDLIAGATCTSNGSSSLTAGTANYVRVNATTLTGSGTLSVRYLGFAPGVPATATIDTTGLATSAAQTDGSQKVQVVNTGGTNLAGAGATLPVAGVKTSNAAIPGATNLGMLPCVANAAAPSLTETYQVACSVDLSGGLRLASTYSVSDPCDGSAKTVVSFSISSATTTELLDGSASNYYYVCSFNIVVGAANNVALVDDVDDTCASPASGLAGGVTAATGWNFAANGGLTLGNGGSTVMKTAGTQRRVCLITSGTAQTSGTIAVVAAP